MGVSFPNESAAYRAARNELLAAELELRARVEAVAAQRRALPPGGLVPEDYRFRRATGGAVRLSELFRPGLATLALYSYMYGPEDAEPCPMCTSFLDGLNGNASHIAERINLAVVIGGPPERAAEIARQRGWHELQLLSCQGTAYNRHYHGESPEGSPLPMMNVFRRDADGIRHFWASETFFADLAGDPRHMDIAWPLWNILDMTPEGRGDWYPALAY